MSTYDTFQKANNKGADQTVQMHRLVCACVVRKPRRQVFLRRGPYYMLKIWFVSTNEDAFRKNLI